MMWICRFGTHAQAVLTASAAALVIGAGGPAAAAPAVPAQATAFNCTAGFFCIYSDWNGGGTRCQWSQSELANTADNCSFIQQEKNVRSVWNNTGHRVQYYTKTNFHSRVGSTEAGAGGNLQGTYEIRSFKPQ